MAALAAGAGCAARMSRVGVEGVVTAEGRATRGGYRIASGGSAGCEELWATA